MRVWAWTLVVASLAASCSEAPRSDGGAPDGGPQSDSMAALQHALTESQIQTERALAVKDSVTRALSTAIELMFELDLLAQEVMGGEPRNAGEAALEEWDQRLRRRIRQIESRVRRFSAEVDSTRQQLSRVEAENEALRASLSNAGPELERLVEISGQQRRRIAELLTQLDFLRDSNRQLVAANVARADTIRRQADEAAHQADEAARVYWIAGTKDELLRKGIIREEGGVFGAIGRSIVPARSFEPHQFIRGDRRTLTEIPLPPGRRWLVVSRHDLSFVDPADLRRDREVGPRLRIVSPEFWNSSPFLILVQR